MMNWPRARTGIRTALLSLLTIVSMTASASAQDTGGNDLRDIRVGMAITDLPIAGYANFACANDAQHKLTGWSGWRDCPADATGRHAVRFGYSAETDREGTIVAGHPVVLTLLIDNAGTIDGLQIDTDPKAQLYLRKKAFLFATQIKSKNFVDETRMTILRTKD